MADMGHETQNTAQQGAESVKNVGKQAANKVKRAASNQVKKVARNVGKKAVRALGKAVAKIAKTIIQLLIKLIALLGPIGLIIFAILIILAGCFVFVLDERGSNESNNLDPDVQNPSYMENSSGITKAVALTEPQAVIDAYYKYMSCSSYVKAYSGKLWEFQDADKTEDFAGLRDYNKLEENFYLSDDFIRTLDELLHDEAFYYPEQVIKPVFGQQITLKDMNGSEADYYTSRLPFDTPDGQAMMDPEYVMDFGEMLGSSETLTAPGTTGDDAQLLPQSQTPTSTSEENYFKLQDRNVVFGDSVATESGLWDYGFGSVLQYQPDQKLSYIECSYDKMDVDFDYEHYEMTGYDDDGNPIWEWVHYHGYVESRAVTGGLDAFKQACNDICEGKKTDDTRWHYHLPTNAAAIFDNTEAWDMGSEPNSAAEAAYTTSYGRAFVNSHIDMKITNAWDSDIDKVQFNDQALIDDYQNVGGGLYPLKIALVSHAATFSGNIHYTITPAGTDGCIKEVSELSVNSTPEIDHREPVQTVKVAGGCDEATLTAHRTGQAITQRPRVQEATSPWGFEYLQGYSNYYNGYVPKDYMEDRDFFVRTGLAAADGSDEKKVYEQNLAFLMDLGLLRLYTGNVQLGAVGSVDLASLNDPNSDLYILAHVIAAEAGPNKLDELMVASVFVNRVASDKYPNSFQGVLQAAGQYACYTDGNYQRAQPTDSEIASAIQVLSGQFSIPENVTGQSASIQGTIYKMVDNPPGLNDHYYCTMGNEAISTVDRYGRPAPDAAQLDALASSLGGSSPTEAGATSSPLDFSTTAFVGDSLTVGLDQTAGLSSKGALVIAEVGNSIAQAKRACEASTELNSNIRTVYLLIGTNSCGLDNATFESQYRELLTTIETQTVGARIILTSLPPVIDGKSNATNAHIDAKNNVIASIAASTGYKVLDIHTILLKNGQLNTSYSADGLHLNSDGYSLWFSKIQAGLVTSGIGQNPANAYELRDGNGVPIMSRYTLYDISQFDVLTATNMQARLTQPDSGLLAALRGILDTIIDTIDQIAKFFEGIKEVFIPERTSTLSFKFARPYNDYDIKSVVFHSIAFANQVWFSTAESAAETAAEQGGLTFLFVGKNNLLGLGTVSGTTIRSVPGIGTSVDGMISPTSVYYQPLTQYSPTTGYMELSTPVGTNVLAVADGTIVDVGNDSADAMGKHVTMSATIGGDTYKITYGYLETISTVAGRSIGKGDLIGTTGKKPDGTAAMYLSVTKNGKVINPMTIFYQMTYTSGPGLAGNLNKSDGSVDEALITALEQELTSYVQSGGGIYHNTPLNTLQYKQCTWWAFGRGFQYVQSLGLPITVDQYRAAIHGNGGQYADNNAAAGLFNYGSTPKANSLVCYPGSPGHVAYVEAVDNVNRVYYISEAGSGNWWGGINRRDFNYAASGSGGQYGRGVFIYLDEPLR